MPSRGQPLSRSTSPGAGMLGVYAGAISLPLRVSLRQLVMQPGRRRVRPVRALLLPTVRTAVEVG